MAQFHFSKKFVLMLIFDMPFISANTNAIIVKIVANENVNEIPSTPNQSPREAGYITSGIRISHGPSTNKMNSTQKFAEFDIGAECECWASGASSPPQPDTSPSVPWQ